MFRRIYKCSIYVCFFVSGLLAYYFFHVSYIRQTKITDKSAIKSAYSITYNPIPQHSKTKDKNRTSSSTRSDLVFNSLTRITLFIEGAKAKNEPLELIIERIGKLEDPRLRNCLVQGYLSAIANSNPQKAWDYFASGVIGGNSEIANSILTKMVEINPEATATTLLQKGKMDFTTFSRAWLARTPADAANWLLKHTSAVGSSNLLTTSIQSGELTPEVLILAAQHQRKTLSTQVVRAMFNTSLSNSGRLSTFFKWANTLPKYQQTVVEGLAYSETAKRSNFQEALQIATELPSLPASYQVVEKWADGRDRNARARAFEQFTQSGNASNLDPVVIRKILVD